MILFFTSFEAKRKLITHELHHNYIVEILEQKRNPQSAKPMQAENRRGVVLT